MSPGSVHFTEIFPFLLLFARLMGLFSIVPGFGDKFINTKIRILFALSISIALIPLLEGRIPEAPESPFLFGLYIISEGIIGLFIGSIARFMFIALDVAGGVIGYQSGLINAFINDPATQQQSALVGTFLSMVALTLLFVTDTHLLIIRALVDSYQVFSPGGISGYSSFTETLMVTLVEALRLSFITAFKIASPFIIMSTLLFLSLGLLNRLMPQVHIYFVAQPFQIAFSFMVLLVVTAGALALFMERFQMVISAIWEPKLLGS